MRTTTTIDQTMDATTEPEFPGAGAARQYDEGHPGFGILYKYRSVNQMNLDALRRQAIWLALPETLNDPFDCLVRLRTEFGQADLNRLAERIAGSTVILPPLEGFSSEDVLGRVATTVEPAPLQTLVDIAGQVRYKPVLRHLKELRSDDPIWLIELVAMARELVKQLTEQVGVFSLSECPDEQLIWSHYADSHQGYCVGYPCPMHNISPTYVYQVQYEERLPQLSAEQLVCEPGDAWGTLLRTKPDQWSYEKEWRLMVGPGMHGLDDKLLVPRRVVFGARISAENERRVRSATEGQSIDFFRVVLEANDYELRLIRA
jgi:hypothetical protein